jgi:hypothetical protein
MLADPFVHPGSHSDAGGDSTAAPARELAQRRSGTTEVLLVWHPDTARVELSVRDVETGAGFRLDVAPDRAIDAFYHPYAYADTDRAHMH